jgi:hypothetical protein
MFTTIGSRRLGVHSSGSDVDLLGVDCPAVREELVREGFTLKDKGHFILARKGEVEIGLHPLPVAWWIEYAYSVAERLLEDEGVRAEFLRLRATGQKVAAYNMVGIPTNDVLAARGVLSPA